MVETSDAVVWAVRRGNMLRHTLIVLKRVKDQFDRIRLAANNPTPVEASSRVSCQPDFSVDTVRLYNGHPCGCEPGHFTLFVGIPGRAVKVPLIRWVVVDVNKRKLLS